MRLVNLRQTPFQHPFPLVVMAMENEGEVCHHYRTAKDHGSFMDSRGIQIVLSGEERETEQQSDGVTVESLLTVCEDFARHQERRDHRMHLVALKLQAALRALALDESDGVTHSVVVGSDSH